MAEFQNPNQQGTPQNNNSLLIIMVVMIAVFFGLNYFRARNNPQTASPNAPARRSQTDSQPPQPAFGQPAPPDAGQSTNVPAAPTIVATAAATTTVENELYKITFTNQGADVTSWILKNYKDSYNQPLDLVHTQAAQAAGYPLSLYTYDPALTANLNSVLYQPSATGALSAPATLTFKYASGAYQVTKTFTFDDTYVLHAAVQVLHNGAPIRSLISWPGGFGDQEDARSYGYAQLDYSQEAKEKHVSTGKISSGNTLAGNFDWGGVSDLYFAAIFLPDHPDATSLVSLERKITVPKADRHNGLGRGIPSKPSANPAKDDISVPIVGAALGDLSGTTETRIFAGPKSVTVLENIHPTGSAASLEPLIDFGFFGLIGKPLFFALRWIHQHITTGAQGWGWAIVLITAFINIVILPLRIKTMQSALKMQRIQPQMDVIKAKYKSLKVTDPKRNEMNAEIMQLQKNEGVNMFGGCIPTLIQMPLLYAMFSMLPKVVEFRHAHWLWIPDLSAPDPWYLLPALLFISQFLVQWYTPSPGVDPQQQKMMAFMMPAFTGYIALKYAAGLAVYWSVGNLISIATQLIMNRTSLGREMREIATRRARRKAGLGVSKTVQGKTLQGKPARR